MTTNKTWTEITSQRDEYIGYTATAVDLLGKFLRRAYLYEELTDEQQYVADRWCQRGFAATHLTGADRLAVQLTKHGRSLAESLLDAPKPATRSQAAALRARRWNDC